MTLAASKANKEAKTSVMILQQQTSKKGFKIGIVASMVILKEAAISAIPYTNKERFGVRAE